MGNTENIKNHQQDIFRPLVSEILSDNGISVDDDWKLLKVESAALWDCGSRYNIGVFHFSMRNNRLKIETKIIE